VGLSHAGGLTAAHLVEAMMADLMAGPFKGQSFKLHKTDPETGKRRVLSLNG
jgi:hypothetical protein